MAGLLAGGLGALILAGWVLGEERLVQPTAEAVRARPSSGVTLLLLGVASLAAFLSSRGPRSRTAGAALGLGVLLAVLPVVPVLGGLARDAFGLLDLESDLGRPSVLPSPGSLLPLMLVAVGLALRSREDGWGSVGRLAALLTLAVAAFDAIDRGFDVTRDGGLPTAPYPVAGAAILALGLLLRDEDRVPARWLRERSPGARTARRLVPLLLGLPVLAGLAAARGIADGSYAPGKAVGVLVLLTVALLLLVVVVLLRSLDRSTDQGSFAEQSVRLATQQAPLGTFRADARGIVRTVDQGLVDILGPAAEELVGVGWPVLVEPGERRDVSAAWRTARDAREPLARTLRAPRQEGPPRTLEVVVGPVALTGEGEELGWVGTCWDVTDVRRTEEDLRRSRTELTATVDGSPTGILRVGADGRVLDVNHAVVLALGRPEAELVGAPVADVLRAVDVPAQRGDPLLALLADEGPEVSETRRIARADGADAWLRVAAVPVHDADGRVGHALVHVQDVTQQHRAGLRLQQLVDEDELTGLRSRHWLELELDQALDESRGSTAVLQIGLDRFRDVNEAVGHKAGNLVLRAAADRVRAAVGDFGEAARLGGDTFAVVLRDVDLTVGERLAARVVAELEREVVRVEGREVGLSGTAGIAVATPGDGRGADELLAAADASRRRAKGYGDEHVEEAATGRARLAWGDRLRAAMRDERFVLRCWPVVDLDSGRVSRVRGHLYLADRPDEEPVGPEAYADAVDHYDLHGALDRLVLSTAVATLAGGEAPPGCAIAVTVRAVSLEDPTTVARLERELADAGIDPSRLVVELTATSDPRVGSATETAARRVRAAGCRLALAGLGDGGSTMSALLRFDCDEVLVDSALTRAIEADRRSAVLAWAVVDAAAALDVDVAVDGVDDRRILRAVVDRGVGRASGRALGGPTSIGEAVRRVDLADLRDASIAGAG